MLKIEIPFRPLRRLVNLSFVFKVLSDYTFWFTCALTTVVLLVPVAALRFYRSDAHPTLTDKARMFQRHTKREDRKKPDRGKAFSARRSR